MNQIYTPLRYPGGKSQLAPYFKAMFEMNSIEDAHYVEPYAGGAGIALALLFTEYSRHIHLNDINYGVYCFWHSLLNDAEYICRRISNVKLSVATWRRQKAILKETTRNTQAEVGFAFFFINRTSRSGIINGGVIGGLKQEGNYKIDARFNRKELIKKIELIADYKHRISLYNLDAIDFLENKITSLPRKSFVYLDPPYFSQGKRLYTNYYRLEDHKDIAEKVQSHINHKWVVTYDNHPVISDLYKQRRQFEYSLKYSAARCQEGQELMIFSDSLAHIKPLKTLAA